MPSMKDVKLKQLAMWAVLRLKQRKIYFNVISLYTSFSYLCCLTRVFAD